MDTTWKSVEPKSIPDNVFSLIGKQWMLVTAGSLQRWNTMTASWGCLGVLWGMNVSFCFVRNTRYTFEFMNDASTYTLTFFTESYRSALDYCGSQSGRDVDKAAATGLTAVDIDGSVSFSEGRLVMVCRKLYQQDFDPELFVDGSIAKHYPQRDYHRTYIGEVSRCLVPAT